VLPAIVCASAAKDAAGSDDDPAAGQALADVVVRVADHVEGDAARQERAE
jgi:hypothetical protein